MKRTVLSVATVMLLSACGGDNVNNDNVTAEDSNNETNNEEHNNESNEPEEDYANEESEEADEMEETIDENEADEEAVEEEPEILYELHSDHTVRPIDEADEQVVLFTIDDAPDSHGVEMAEVLAELEVPAIFFVNGHFINDDVGAQELQAIYDLGFEIGNHSMTHPNFSQITEEEQYEEIVLLNDKIEEITGERPRFFRAPFGVNTDYSKQVVEDEGMQWMNWTYGYDYFAEYMEKDALAEIMVETELLRNGANLLMHDREFTKEALPDIVSGLREKGYDFVDPDTIQ
ncbi:polysaccharide deacetylase family protein [Salisediminibacterium selenitireducens]|uniref:Polysaccharide deacetylase n=1 Tax=Bacillus selenitireducens (strain ATCC 700615 / DSM 15326 / MLS10) TaxID=439292 RepID=D6XTI0_BACIE|nr:polysaccharide deacetylase family protein [Salisediminibacterium selenitireducens]ADH99116.1 polysaccharide deacetylase [[Bacillus] selenitireducens MLS10]